MGRDTMKDDKLDKVLEGIQDIKVAQAVQYEQISNLTKRMDSAHSRIDKAEHKISSTDRKIDLTNNELEARLDLKLKPLVDKLAKHDRIVAGVIIATSILVTLMKFKVL